MATLRPVKPGTVWLGVFFILWCGVNPLMAQDAALTHITVSNTRDDLLFHFTLEGSFTEKLKEAIISGVPATFTFYISLHQIRNWWPDKKIADITLSRTIKYEEFYDQAFMERRRAYRYQFFFTSAEVDDRDRCAAFVSAERTRKGPAVPNSGKSRG